MVRDAHCRGKRLHPRVVVDCRTGQGRGGGRRPDHPHHPRHDPERHDERRHAEDRPVAQPEEGRGVGGDHAELGSPRSEVGRGALGVDGGQLKGHCRFGMGELCVISVSRISRQP